MNKEINPFLALLIIFVFLIPVGIWTWAAGESALARVGSFYLAQDSSGHLSLQADTHLVTQKLTGQDHQVFNLKELGISDLMGNIVYLPDNDFVVRTGDAEWNPMTAASLGEYEKPDQEIIRDKISKLAQDQNPLAKCNRQTKSCRDYQGLAAPWRHRLFYDKQNESLFIVEGTNHQARRFDKKGDLVGTINTGLKFPKKVRRYQDKYYLTDTNHHRILFFENEIEGLKELNELSIRPPNGDNKWPIDAIFFGQHWWVINAERGMQNAQIQRFDEDGLFVDIIPIPKTSEPFDFLIYEHTLLVSDLNHGAIHRFSHDGNALSDLNSPAIESYFTAVNARRSHYEQVINVAQFGFVLLLVGGCLIGIYIGRKHDKSHPKFEKHSQVPIYLSSGFALSSPIHTHVKEVIVNNILISNIEIVPGKRIKEHLGLVQGSTVRAKHAGKDILAGLKNIFGGELSSYTDLLSESRQEALERMSEQAQAIGANAVINVRFSTSSITAGASEILAYGTAVVLEEK